MRHFEPDPSFDYKRREPGESIAGLEYARVAGGPNGCHVHFWVPRETLDIKETLNKALHKARNDFDVVSASWSYLPMIVENRRDKRKKVRVMVGQVDINSGLVARGQNHSFLVYEKDWVDVLDTVKKALKPQDV